MKLLFTLFEESPLYTNAIFDEKAHKKIFLLFCLKKVQTQLNSKRFSEESCFRNSKFEKTEQGWPNLRWLSMSHFPIEIAIEERYSHCEQNYCFIVSNSPFSLVHIPNYTSVSKLLNRMVGRKALTHLALSVFLGF